MKWIAIYLIVGMFVTGYSIGALPDTWAKVKAADDTIAAFAVITAIWPFVAGSIVFHTIAQEGGE